ncbi:serine protease [Streptomyces sp. WAC05292]|uniref:trypsin-like serine peptidase n=1 Tax=Streptomyces sp. WAC05292 TaxID=2487418 RepID=UPI000F740C52|nr:serine protease [Streptomyces sp. WAC05292]RSS79634.1 serine protease [Streptomyces sp. WAC05292]
MVSKRPGRSAGHPRRARPRRVRLLAGAGGALLAAGGAAYAWGLPGILAHSAAGDRARGSYAADAADGDRAAAALLAGVVREVPAAGRSGQGEASGPAAAPGPTAGPGPAEAPGAPTGPLAARPAVAEPAIGALFSPGEDGDGAHHCSGVVVHAPGGDLVATAAHCVHRPVLGFRTNLVFVPGYRDRQAPHGVWVPTRIDVDPRWAASQDPDHDIAFLRVRRPGRPGERLEDTAGAYPVRFGAGLPLPARLAGYPGGAERPLDCSTTAVAESATQLRLDCADVPNGTSGGPVLAGGRTLIGVIGGRDGGGDEWTSYSIRFGDAARELYERATRSG